MAEGTLGGRPAATSGQPDVAPDTAAKATFSEVFANSEFRALWLALLLSVIGDQLARVAMTLLVYDRTRSPLLAALTYAATFLPWIVGGVALSGLADRLPRREVMITCDLVRMTLVCLIALVSLIGSDAALWGMVALLFGVTLFDSPFKAARSALFPDILAGESYVLGTALTQLTLQIAMVAGFVLGGVIVATLGSRTALIADAATFALSALILGLQVRRRLPAANAVGNRSESQLGEMIAGIRVVFGDRTLRSLTLFGWLVAFYIIPMGLAAPYAATFHGLTLAVGTGLAFAAIPFGTAVGSFVFGRLLAPDTRARWMGPLAAASCGVLMLCWLKPGLAASLAIFTVAGLCASYQIAANAAFVRAVPADRRGQAFGLANGGMQVLQGVGFILAGAMAERISASSVIAASGLLGAVAATALMAMLPPRATEGRPE